MGLRPLAGVGVLLLACFQTEHLIYLYQSKLKEMHLHQTIFLATYRHKRHGDSARLKPCFTAGLAHYLSFALLQCVEGNFIQWKVLEFNFTQQTEYILFPFILLSSSDWQTALSQHLFLSRPWNDLVLMRVWSRVSWAFSSRQIHKQSLPPHTHTHTHALSLSLSQIPLARLCGGNRKLEIKRERQEDQKKNKECKQVELGRETADYRYVTLNLRLEAEFTLLRSFKAKQGLRKRFLCFLGESLSKCLLRSRSLVISDIRLR